MALPTQVGPYGISYTHRGSTVKTALEAVLQAMVTGGWANESGGTVDAPTGHYARVSVSADEVGSVVDAFEDVLAVYPLDSLTQLIGEWLVQEDDQGFVTVTAYDNPIALTRDYLAMDDAFALWDEQ
jgi:hypothetical protein